MIKAFSKKMLDKVQADIAKKKQQELSKLIEETAQL